MTPLKQSILVILVILAILMSGIGGLRDVVGGGMSAQHGWSDANFILLLAILVALTLK